MKKGYILLIAVFLMSEILSIRLFSQRRKRRRSGKDDKCNIKVSEKCELYEDGKHNCEEGLQCALFCEKKERGKCQYWCVKKVGATCSTDAECLFEYCDKDSKCAVRKAHGASCVRDEECFSFICSKKNQMCEKPAVDECINKDLPKGCDEHPMKVGCPSFCQQNPSHPECFKDDRKECEINPDARGCKKFCENYPEDASCNKVDPAEKCK